MAFILGCIFDAKEYSEEDEVFILNQVRNPLRSLERKRDYYNIDSNWTPK
jgi:hypothetical protein